MLVALEVINTTAQHAVGQIKLTMETLFTLIARKKRLRQDTSRAERATHRKDIFMAKKPFKIPGLSFSWKRALGISKVKQKISKSTGIPMSKAGRQRKFGKMLGIK